MSIITISREYGAGGHSIGTAVAKELGIEFYDRDIIRSTAREAGLSADIVEHKEEEISRASAFWRMITPAAYTDQRETIHAIEQRMILQLAFKGNCVLLGRCADVILNTANIECLNVFIYADELHRAHRVGQLIGSSDPTEIQKVMRRTDSARRAYYEQFTANRWGDSRNYNLCLDSGLLGYATCVKLICEAARGLHSGEV